MVPACLQAFDTLKDLSALESRRRIDTCSLSCCLTQVGSPRSVYDTGCWAGSGLLSPERIPFAIAKLEFAAEAETCNPEFSRQGSEGFVDLWRMNNLAVTIR